MDGKKYFWLIFTISLAGVTDAMTRAQMKNTGKMLKNNCLKKIQVSEELIDGIGQGKFVEDKNLMCFIACMLELTNVIKKNKINIEASLKQIDMMYPADVKESAKAALLECKDVRSCRGTCKNKYTAAKKHKDICDASFWMAKCMYDYKPEDFIFL